MMVACKDFIVPGLQFVPFNDVGESTLDQDKERYQLEAVYHHIDMNEIDQLILKTPFLTNIHKEFLQCILQHRYELILRTSYLKLSGGEA